MDDHIVRHWEIRKVHNFTLHNLISINPRKWIKKKKNKSKDVISKSSWVVKFAKPASEVSALGDKLMWIISNKIRVLFLFREIERFCFVCFVSCAFWQHRGVYFCVVPFGQFWDGWNIRLGTDYKTRGVKGFGAIDAMDSEVGWICFDIGINYGLCNESVPKAQNEKYSFGTLKGFYKCIHLNSLCIHTFNEFF